jgi:putative sterol carrier protein
VVAYLSDEWLERAGAALAASDELAERTADLELAIAYEVTGAPSGKVAYTISFDHGTTTLTTGRSDAPVSFQLDYDTAAEIARGELSAQAAFMQGRLKLVGDVNVLIRDGAVLDGVADALGDLRADTEF